MTDKKTVTEKKSERLEVRLGYAEKSHFVEACDLQGDTPSGAVRRFISGYTKRADSDVLASAWRGAVRRRLFLPLAGVAAIGVLGVSGVGLMRSHDTPDAETVFKLRDTNSDGYLTLTEANLTPRPDGSPNVVFRVLDLDNSSTLSRDEFMRTGRMIFTESIAAYENDEPPVMMMVEFEFLAETVRYSTFEGAQINAKGIDRLVLWPVDGLPTVMSGQVEILTGVDNIEIYSDRATAPSQADESGL